LRELESSMSVDRPFIVLDCSHVHRLDRSVVEVLLCCLEEAIKRNGDVKLASIPSGAEAILELTGVNRLFEIFDTTAGAVHSFHQPVLEGPRRRPCMGCSPRGPQRAAQRVCGGHSCMRKVSAGLRKTR